MVTLRKLLAMLLLAVFGLPVVLSSLAAGQGTDAGLPACCRRTGKHHCGMSMGERSAEANAAKAPAWQAPPEQCPYCPACPVTGFHVDLQLPGATSVRFEHEFGPAARVQRAECCRRIARERARQKRGPPAPLRA